MPLDRVVLTDSPIRQPFTLYSNVPLSSERTSYAIQPISRLNTDRTMDSSYRFSQERLTRILRGLPAQRGIFETDIADLTVKSEVLRDTPVACANDSRRSPETAARSRGAGGSASGFGERYLCARPIGRHPGAAEREDRGACPRRGKLRCASLEDETAIRGGSRATELGKHAFRHRGESAAPRPIRSLIPEIRRNTYN